MFHALNHIFLPWKVDKEQKITEAQKPYLQWKRHFQRETCLGLLI